MHDPDPRYLQLGQAMRAVRRQLGRSQTFLADRMGYTRQHLSAFETGRDLPIPDTWHRWLDAVSATGRAESDRDDQLDALLRRARQRYEQARPDAAAHTSAAGTPVMRPRHHGLARDPTQEDLADALGSPEPEALGVNLEVSGTTVGTWKRSEYQPDAPHRKVLRSPLGTDSAGLGLHPPTPVTAHDATHGINIDTDAEPFFDRLEDPVIFPYRTEDRVVSYLTLSRREFLRAARMSAGATGVAIAESGLMLGSPPRRTGGTIGKSISVTGADVDAVRDYTQTVRYLDNRFGGGHVHALAIQFLQTTLAPMLRGRYTEKTGQELYRAAAQLAHLAAWTAYDMGMHEHAQFYFGQALDLSVGAGDRAFSGEILAAKGHQAIHLGNAGQAIELARASQNSAKSAAVPALLAEAYALEANAHAFLGESKECADCLRQAESAFTRVQSSEVPVWLRYFDEGYLAARIAHSMRDVNDWHQSRAYALQAVEMNDGLTRTRAFNYAILATTYIQSDIDEACRIGLDVLDVAVRLRSSRLIRYINEFRRRLHESHQDEPAVKQFNERVMEALRN